MNTDSKTDIDYSLYVVTDRSIMSSETIEESVECAIRGGATVIQLREKNISSREFYYAALSLRGITERHNVPLIINDRADIAFATDADGVHIGQKDIPARILRRIVGRKAVIGVSVENVSEALAAEKDGADYIGVGAMFPTDTKTDAAAVSMEELKLIRRAVDLPIVVIGGINKDNAKKFIDTGIQGLAVVSAVISQPDIEKAAKEMRHMAKQL